MPRSSWRKSGEEFVNKVRRRHKKNRVFAHTELVEYIASRHPRINTKGWEFCLASTHSQLRNAGFGGVIGLSDLYLNWDRINDGGRIYYRWTDGDSTGWDKDYDNPEKREARNTILQYANLNKTTLVFAATKGYEVQALRAKCPRCEIWNCEAFKPVLAKWVKFRDDCWVTRDFNMTDKRMFSSDAFVSQDFGLINYDVMRSVGSHLDHTLSLLDSAANAEFIAITVCRSAHHNDSPKQIEEWAQERLSAYSCRLLVTNYRGDIQTSPMTVLLATRKKGRK